MSIDLFPFMMFGLGFLLATALAVLVVGRGWDRAPRGPQAPPPPRAPHLLPGRRATFRALLDPTLLPALPHHNIDREHRADFRVLGDGQVELAPNAPCWWCGQPLLEVDHTDCH